MIQIKLLQRKNKMQQIKEAKIKCNKLKKFEGRENANSVFILVGSRPVPTSSPQAIYLRILLFL